MEGDEIQKLLREIRDTQREHLAEYRHVTQRSLELQQHAVAVLGGTSLPGASENGALC
jgi:hypothetical protein